MNSGSCLSWEPSGRMAPWGNRHGHMATDQRRGQQSLLVQRASSGVQLSIFPPYASTCWLVWLCANYFASLKPLVYKSKDNSVSSWGCFKEEEEESIKAFYTVPGTKCVFSCETLLSLSMFVCNLYWHHKTSDDTYDPWRVLTLELDINGL